MQLRIHRFLPLTHVEGPGARACIWVQGCPIHCPGCAVPHTWSPDGGEAIDTEELAAHILAGPQIEGVTFLGGEPFAQAAALAELGKTLSNANLGVLTFTGYRLEYLQQMGREDYLDLLAVTDLLIDGPYRADLADYTRPWVGSSNKRYHFLTPRYIGAVDLSGQRVVNRIEVRLAPDGQVSINGMADLADLEAMFEDLFVDS